jgi:GTPase SAR1 family protein
MKNLKDFLVLPSLGVNMKNLKDFLLLPKVIVIGTESSGKSSLLERITKCQLFPRDGKICTKCPIKVKLQNGKPSYSIQLPGDTIQQLENKKDIYPIVQNYMNSLSDDFISENEIIINITDIDVPDFEFYDLPGIRTYPSEIAELSVNICKKYLTDKNSIVLCVVPCTTTRLTSCQSIALITEAKMEHNTILALTMTDRLQAENMEELLINRIIYNTLLPSCAKHDCNNDELNGIKFANCIAVVNRSQYTNYTLEESDHREKEWFNKNIYQCIPYKYKKNKKQIIQRTTILKLLKSMDNLYNHFIHTDWIPRMLIEMRAKEETIKKEINELGTIITKDNFIEMLNEYSSFADFFQDINIVTLFNNKQDIRFDISRSNNKFKISNEINKLFDHNIETVRDFVLKDVKSIFDNMKIDFTFKSDIFDGPSKRFVNLSKKCDKIFLEYSKHVFVKEFIEPFKNNYINYSISTVYYANKLDNNINLLLRLGSLFSTMFHDTYNNIYNMYPLELTFLESLFFRIFHDLNDDIRMLWSELAVKDFAESDEWKEKRLKLKMEETKIKCNIDKINMLSSVIIVSDDYDNDYDNDYDYYNLILITLYGLIYKTFIALKFSGVILKFFIIHFFKIFVWFYHIFNFDNRKYVYNSY